MLATLITLVTFLLLLRAVFHSSSFPDIANLIKSTINKSTVNKQVKLHKQLKGTQVSESDKTRNENGCSCPKSDGTVWKRTLRSENGRSSPKSVRTVRNSIGTVRIRMKESEIGRNCLETDRKQLTRWDQCSSVFPVLSFAFLSIPSLPPPESCQQDINSWILVKFWNRSFLNAPWIIWRPSLRHASVLWITPTLYRR